MAESDLEKTEAATPRRREEARNEGNVVRSMDLSAAATLLAGIILLKLFGFRLTETLSGMTRWFLSGDPATNPTRLEDLSGVLALGGSALGRCALPMILGLACVALLVTVAQVGFLVTGTPLAPRLSRLSPLRGIKNLVSMRAGMRLGMSLAKVVVIGLVASVLIMMELDDILTLGQIDARSGLGLAVSIIFWFAVKLALVLLILGLLDYAYQRWQRERDLRMTRIEVKDEMKRMEGDPLVKQRRTRVARQLALQRISHDVPTADVVVTNPTHFAVALRYVSEKMTSPRVVAKGADFMAMRIRQVAAQHSVPTVERKELARALYRNVEVGQEVPPEHYNAVAEILAYVYRLDRKESA